MLSNRVENARLKSTKNIRWIDHWLSHKDKESSYGQLNFYYILPCKTLINCCYQVRLSCPESKSIIRTFRPAHNNRQTAKIWKQYNSIKI